MQNNLSNSWTYHGLPVVVALVLVVIVGVVAIAVVVVVDSPKNKFDLLWICSLRETEIILTII